MAPGIFPNLKTVVVVGHSAGGQFVNRYAAGGAGCPNPLVEVRYVIMNPSSYLYVDDLGPIVDRFLASSSSETAYNVVPDWTDDLYDLAERVKARSGKDIPIVVGAPGSGLPYNAANDRLRREFPDVRFTTVDAAIDDLYHWYETNQTTIDRAALVIDK